MDLIAVVLQVMQALELERLALKRNDALKTHQWTKLRYQALLAADGRCKCCGASAVDGAELHVDHIKPKSLYPELTFEFTNLQVLCRDCNMGKSNIDETDWARKSLERIVGDIAK